MIYFFAIMALGGWADSWYQRVRRAAERTKDRSLASGRLDMIATLELSLAEQRHELVRLLEQRKNHEPRRVEVYRRLQSVRGELMQALDALRRLA